MQHCLLLSWWEPQLRISRVHPNKVYHLSMLRGRVTHTGRAAHEAGGPDRPHTCDMLGLQPRSHATLSLQSMKQPNRAAGQLYITFSAESENESWCFYQSPQEVETARDLSIAVQAKDAARLPKRRKRLQSPRGGIEVMKWVKWVVVPPRRGLASCRAVELAAMKRRVAGAKAAVRACTQPRRCPSTPQVRNALPCTRTRICHVS